MKEFEYPMWFKSLTNDQVIEFDSIDTGTVVKKGFLDECSNIGYYDLWIPHTDVMTWVNVTDQYKDKATIPPLEMCGTPISVREKAHNNGGSTDYYKLKTTWEDLADIMEDRSMNYNQGNIFKSAFCFNVGRHDGTSYERELNKIIYFAERELKRIKNVEA